MSFLLNYKTKFEIDTTPGAAPTYVVIAAGITGVDVSNNEQTDETAYYDGNGAASTDVIGFQVSYSFSGHRAYGDPAMDFIFGKRFEIGDARRTKIRVTEPDGGVITGEATISGLSGPGGEANGKGDISFELKINGKPTYVPGP
jgi:hypothetical protein